jgi:hypothetical protein
MTDKRVKSSDARRPVPISPLSVVRVAYGGRSRSFRKHNGRIFRVGYYSKMDGLDCIWLVNDDGHYERTVDHQFLYWHFDIIQFADHTNWYGRRRPKILPIRLADRRALARKK